MSIREAWDKFNIILAAPVGVAFVALAVFGKLCFENLPYMICK